MRPFLALALALIVTPVFAADTDVAIDEVFYVGDNTADYIGLSNTGATNVDISGWWLCRRFSYTQLSAMTIIAGVDLDLGPGERVVLRIGADLDDTSSDIGIYTTNSFGNSTAMVDFVQYGTSADVGRSDVALAKGIWSETSPGVYDFVAAASAGQSLQWNFSNSGGGLLTLSADFSNAQAALPVDLMDFEIE